MTFLGSEACTGCHAKEVEAWRGSHHALAMQEANQKTVLGDFGDRRFTHAGVTSTFSARDGKYFVRTDGPDGKLTDYEVKYTFGVTPLQQYLLELPGGRLQALTIAWDTRPRQQGGQRWFHLQPSERIDYRDELHWTGLQQNWNYMCADCHSTDLRKNYDEKNNTYATKWSEINVACEACHGPGSSHVAWANGGKKSDATKGLTVALDERAGVTWTIDASSGNAARSRPRSTDAEIQVCAQCHARRAQIAGDYHAGKPFLDHYLPSLLTQPLYYVDGQQRDEVYNWGSFLQSKMFAKGVTCADCHDPHSGKPRAPGNAVCYQCHSAEKYGVSSHHRHRPDTPAASCPACHMPVRNYMVIDGRHDHSFRVPRPDQSVSLGTPNACNDCHRNRKPAWAAAAVEKWHGPQRKGFQTFAPALQAADTGALPAGRLLLDVALNKEQSAIARATAYNDLVRYLSSGAIGALPKGLADGNALVRYGAVEALSGLDAAQRWGPGNQLLTDPVRVVRLAAVSALAGTPASALDAKQRAELDRAIEEYVASQRFNADRPESHLNLGALYAQRGDHAAAEGEYRKAIALSPHFLAAYVNLADLYRQTGRDAEGEKTLRTALKLAPDNAAVYHALGLLLVREKRYGEALDALARAARLNPADARYAYVYGVALDSTGKRGDAIKVLQASHRRHPGDRETLVALVTLNRDAGAVDAALDYARKLDALAPGDPGVRQLMRELGGR